MDKLQFKRNKGGGGSDWGAGWDYLLKDFYDDLDEIVENNYLRNHDPILVDKVFDGLFDILDSKAIPKMEQLKKENDDEYIKERCQDWIDKIELLNDFFKNANTLPKKVIAIDSLTQFLRETDSKDSSQVGEVDEIVTNLNSEEEIKGVAASHGIVSGRVKLILDLEKDSSKMQEDEILVTKETSAVMLPLMLKAGAVVTDIGGLLSHAAIVSRELEKPCIVGVGIATRILKDGDLVEVNADDGIVKILKKNYE